MFKKITLLLSVALPFSCSQAFANWEEFEIREGKDNSKTVKAIWKSSHRHDKFTLESADPASFNKYVDTLKSLPIKEGYPAIDNSEKNFKFQNIDRQNAGNLYHLFTLSYRGEKEEDKSLGFIQFGRMPSKGYQEGTEKDPIAHHAILEKWLELGVTHKINPDGGLNDSNIERIENRGLAMILPLFKPEASEDQRKGTIETCFEFVRELKKGNYLLPVEKTLPHVAIGLFIPNDSNVGSFSANDFNVDGNEGFAWFYPKDGEPNPRVMVTRQIEIKE